MQNIATRVEGGKLVITIDISEAARKAAQPSKSGKTRVVASTHGNVALADAGVTIGLNAYFAAR